jgi:capsular polysaccharide biosynthesis protein
MAGPPVGQQWIECVDGCGETAHSRVDGSSISRSFATRFDGSGEGQGVSVLHLLAILIRRRRTIAAVVVCGTALLVLAGWLISPAYTAFAQIGVISPTARTTGSTWPDQRASQVLVDTHMVMLRSRDFLRNVIVSLDEGAHAKSPREVDLRLEQFERHLTISQSLSSGVISVAYTSKDPEEAAKVANEIVTLYSAQLTKRESASLQTELDQLGRRIADIDRAGSVIRAQIQARLLGSLKPSPTSPDDTKEQLGKLEMEGRTNAQIQVDLLRRQAEIRQRLEASPQQVWIVSLATAPVTPSSLPRWLLIIPGATVLLIGSCFWVIASEQLDNRLRTARDVDEALSMSCIGMVPRLPPVRPGRSSASLEEEPFAPYAESIRSIAAALGVSEPSRPSQTVLLSCCEPTEGIARLAVSLAHCAASIGRRVLLVDLDTRTPGLLNELRMESAHDLDLVLDDAPLQEVVRRHPVLAFDCLPMKAGQIDPLRLIASGKLHAALRAFRADYDLVIISGPAALQPEAPLLAAMVDKVLFVLRWGTTWRDTAQNAVRILCEGNPVRRDPPDFMAAVLTEVPT